MEKPWKYPRQKQFEKILKVHANDWFIKKGFDAHPAMPYCLRQPDDWKLNIILPETVDLICTCKQNAADSGKPFPLHKYLHHGLSSQAMAFNLIGPLVTRGDYSPLEKLLKNRNIIHKDISSVVFEFENRDIFNETAGQPTSIDIALRDKENKPLVFVESKLVESEFGGCSVFIDGDCPGMNPVNNPEECYLHFIGRKYWNLMEKHGVTKLLANDRICPFTVYYQFFREILLSAEYGCPFVLLCDERSSAFEITPERGLIPFLKTFLPENLKSMVHIVTIQEVVDSIERTEVHKDWIEEFGEKYGV